MRWDSPLYRILLGEAGASGWVDSYVTRHPDPVKVAKRLMRLVNHLENYPGGYDQVYSRVGIQRVGIWPDGDGFITVVRAGRSPDREGTSQASRPLAASQRVSHGCLSTSRLAPQLGSTYGSDMAHEAFEVYRPGKTAIATIVQADKIIREYQADGLVLTLRQLYYQFVSRALIPNTERSYKNLGTVVTKARMRPARLGRHRRSCTASGDLA